MKRRFFLVLAALTACIPIVAAQDDGAKAAVLASQKALHEAKAYRIRTTATDLDSKRVTAMTVEIVNPDSLRMHMEEGGQVKMELVTDGRKAFMRRGAEGDFVEAPPTVAGMVANARRLSAMEAIQTASNVKMVGREDIGGTAASVYTFEVEIMGMRSTSKLWVSDKDHLPLKREGESHGEVKLGAEPGQKTNRSSTSTYDYDPSIKVTLPTS